jgi:hypothetical protein
MTMPSNWIHHKTQLPTIGERVLYCFCEPDHEHDSNEVEIGVWLGEMNKGGSLVMEQRIGRWCPGNYWMPLPVTPSALEEGK